MTPFNPSCLVQLSHSRLGLLGMSQATVFSWMALTRCSPPLQDDPDMIQLNTRLWLLPPTPEPGKSYSLGPCLCRPCQEAFDTAQTFAWD